MRSSQRVPCPPPGPPPVPSVPGNPLPSTVILPPAATTRLLTVTNRLVSPEVRLTTPLVATCSWSKKAGRFSNKLPPGNTSACEQNSALLPFNTSVPPAAARSSSQRSRLPCLFVTDAPSTTSTRVKVPLGCVEHSSCPEIVRSKFVRVVNTGARRLMLVLVLISNCARPRPTRSVNVHEPSGIVLLPPELPALSKRSSPSG